jgi:hypothetical protein
VSRLLLSGGSPFPTYGSFFLLSVAIEDERSLRREGEGMAEDGNADAGFGGFAETDAHN